MKERLKIIVTWILLSLLLINAGLGFFIFEFSLVLNKSLVEEFLSESDEKDLFLLVINDKSKIVWLDNHEFNYDGKRYDVKSEIIKNGKSYFYCIHDSKEESLISSFKSCINNTFFALNGKRGSHSFSVGKYLYKIYYHSDLPWEYPGGCNFDFTFLPDVKISLQNYSTVISPPPEC